MSTNTFCANHYNVETGQWEYAPRYVEMAHGRLISQRCARCGQEIDIRRPTALCTNCQIEKPKEIK